MSGLSMYNLITINLKEKRCIILILFWGFINLLYYTILPLCNNVFYFYKIFFYWYKQTLSSANIYIKYN